MNKISKIFESIQLIRRYFKEAESSASLRNIAYRHTPHFYSPLTDLEYIKANEDNIFTNPKLIRGININASRQLELLTEFGRYYEELPFSSISKSERFQFENGFYSYGDATILYCFMRYLQPKKIIEVGSGYSSAAMLDVSDIFFDSSIEFTFIEPFPERLKALLRQSENNLLVEKFVQDVSISEYSKLQANDILFIDSSHISKTGSDLNHILFNILPVLSAGVYIHFHDIAWPFEYPKKWIYEGRCWNEAYILRALLSNSNQYSIQYFNDYIVRQHIQTLEQHLPICLKNGGASLWLKKE